MCFALSRRWVAGTAHQSDVAAFGRRKTAGDSVLNRCVLLEGVVFASKVLGGFSLLLLNPAGV
jgi:hypothetical protein